MLHEHRHSLRGQVQLEDLLVSAVANVDAVVMAGVDHAGDEAKVLMDDVVDGLVGKVDHDNAVGMGDEETILLWNKQQTLRNVHTHQELHCLACDQRVNHDSRLVNINPEQVLRQWIIRHINNVVRADDSPGVTGSGVDSQHVTVGLTTSCEEDLISITDTGQALRSAGRDGGGETEVHVADHSRMSHVETRVCSNKHLQKENMMKRLYDHDQH